MILTIKSDIYPITFVVGIDCCQKKFSKEIESYGVSREDIDGCLIKSGMYGRTCLLEENIVTLQVDVHPSDKNFFPLLAHETFHATTYAMHRLGLSFDHTISDEAYAYLQQYLFKKILKNLKICVRP